MFVRASIVIISHLSDLAEETMYGHNPLNTAGKLNSINFVKYLVLKYPDTSFEIDPDAEWQRFLNRHQS